MNDDPMANEVPGLSYFTIDGAGDQRFFRCEAHRATLSTSACAKRWQTSQRATGQDADRFEKCFSCPIGAAHNGVELVHRSPLFGKSICPRTRTWTNRMIHDRVSVAMRNRELEFLKGRDCKGHVRQFRFDPRRLAVVIDGKRQELRDDLTSDLTEMVIATLRTVPGKLVFTRARMGSAAISTIELAAMYRPKGAERRQNSGVNAQRANAAREANQARRAKTVEGVVAAVADDMRRRAAAKAGAAWRAAEAVA